MIITLQLEQKLSKEEIFEDYCNQIYLGSRGTFRIHGFGEAAESFLGKDLSQINLPEAAELAGLPRWPAYFDPFRHPDHLQDRRNAVLALMRQNGDISDRDYALAIEAPLTVAKGSAQSMEAPYFVDMVNDTLQNKFQDADFQSNAFRVYSTIDMRLQRAAAEAIRMGMEKVDEQIRKQRRFKGQTPPEPQVALIALDPHTGEIKALVGGRNYGASQLNHVLAQRAAGVDLQAVRLRRGHGYRRGRRPARAHPQQHRGGRADHLLVRRQSNTSRSNFEKKYYGDDDACAKRWRTRSTWPP